MTTKSPDAERWALLRVRARRLTDPLGAKGFRRARARIEAERRARRVAFVATFAGFAALTGLIAVTADREPAPPAAVSAPVGVSVAGNLAPADPSRFVRGRGASALEAPAPAVHKRTRSS